MSADRQQPRQQGSRQGKLRVMLVDDQPLVRDLLKVRLDLDGRFTVVSEAVAGGEALVMARNHRPDVVVLDVGMPGISGLTVLPALAEECPDARIVVYTGNSDGDLAQAAKERGAHFVADKLMNVADLIGAIVGLFEGDERLARAAQAVDGAPVEPT